MRKPLLILGLLSVFFASAKPVTKQISPSVGLHRSGTAATFLRKPGHEFKLGILPAAHKEVSVFPLSWDGNRGNNPSSPGKYTGSKKSATATPNITVSTISGSTSGCAGNALPSVDPMPDLTFANGDMTTPINFSGTGNTFYWTNDKPSIGLAASGGDNIAPFKAVNYGTSPVVAHISLKSQIANVAYIPDYNSNTVSVVNTITNKIIATVPVGASPGYVAISPDGKKAYVANVSGTSLSIINTQTNQSKDISIFDTPTSVIFSKDGTRAYVAGVSGECTVIDVANDAVLTALTFPSGSSGIALSNDGQSIYATNSATGDVWVYDTSSNAAIITIPTPGGLYAVTSPDGSKIYVTGSYSNCVYVIDAASNTLSATISLSADAEGITVSPDGSQLYVTNQNAGTVTVINTASNSVLVSFPVGKSPQGISVTPDGKYVYVANVDSGTLSVISTSNYTVSATIPCGTSPHAVGNFITPGINTCTGNPINFKITVNTSPTTITPGEVGGLISTCIGAPSTSLQQFDVSGNNLSGNITATAPAGFELSLTQTSGFAGVLALPPVNGAVISEVIYVRAKASGTPANLSGNIVLSTPGATSKSVAVKGVVNDLPVSNALANQVYNNGDNTAAITFNGTANTYTWANDKPSIGIAASGVGDIPSFTAINTGAAPVKATITATPSSDDYLYLTGKNGVLLVDAENDKQTGSVNTGGEPAGIAVSPDGSLVAVTDLTGNTVKFINTLTHKVVSTVNNIPSPLGICFSPDGKKVYTANENNATVSVIDVATATARPPFYVGYLPYGIAASPDGSTVYVGCIGENAIIAINTQTLQTTPIKVTFGPTGIAVSPDGTRVYATSAQYNGTLKIVDAATRLVVATVPVGDASTGICVSPDGKRVYVANYLSSNAMVVDLETNKVIATITVGHRPFGVSITPDGKYVYIANEDSNQVDVINTADNSISNIISLSEPLTVCFGNFYVPGTGCSGTPVKFSITVNGSPGITAGAVTGSITTCTGTPSTTTQQFTVSGSNLAGDITVTAPANFEVSLSQTGSFANSLIIAQKNGTVTTQAIYVRAAASGTAGIIAGNITLASAGLPDQTVAVNGAINALPTVALPADQNFNAGEATTAINFTGTATTYSWVNDNPAIGLPASGSGDIPSFTAINKGQTVITANITVLPSDASCTGSAATFKINISPNPPSLTVGVVTGSITACQGSPSTNPDLEQFTVSGSGLIGNVQVTAPPNFEVSLNLASGYTITLTLAETAGKVANTIIYIRSVASAPAGNHSGTVTISSTGATSQTVAVSAIINAIPVVDPVSSLTIYNGDPVPAINFTGTATTYAWINDTPGIGLPAGGTGGILPFTAINNTAAPVIATITVLPSSSFCTGVPVTFKITVNPNPPPVITVAGNLSPLNTVYGTPSASESFKVSGSNFLSGITVTPPAGFEVSTDGSNFKSAVTMGSAGTLSSTVVYIRLAKTTVPGGYSGNIVLSTAGTINKLNMPESSVTPAPLIITADNKSRPMRSENPPFTITYRGFVNNETELNLVKQPEAGTTATQSSTPGNYTISFTGNAESPNYSFTYLTGILTITSTDVVVVVNTFSPNGDGINDTWAIKYIEFYPKCTVDVFNRWGAKLFSSAGYGEQWNGQSGNTPVPAGTYYYVINLGDGSPPRSGWIAVLR